MLSSIILYQNEGPVPFDIPLPYPAPELFLAVVLIVSFLAHIFFINLMLGGIAYSVLFEYLGIKNKKYDELAKQIVNTITVNKSLAVVIGVAPLLVINTLYTIYFYSANALTGAIWISIVPLVTIGFLLLYWYKYTWDKYAHKKTFHLLIGVLALVIFLFVPLIFLTNINLMLFPKKWEVIEGFISALLLQNTIFRYFHFLAGTTALSGLFFFWYFGRKKYPFETRFKFFEREEIKKLFLKIGFFATLSNLVFGPVLLFTLPWFAVDWNLGYIVIAGAALAIISLIHMYRSFKGKEKINLKRIYPVFVILTITVALMGWGRHTYRENALSEHKKLVKIKTEQHLELSRLAQEEALNNGEVASLNYKLKVNEKFEFRKDIITAIKAVKGVNAASKNNKEELIVNYSLAYPDIELRIDKAILTSGYLIDRKNRN